MSLPDHRVNTATPVPHKRDLAVEATQMKWAADTASWTDTAMRPDLYPAPVQRKVAGQSAGQDLPVDGGGKAMPEDVQAKMEAAFATDFSAVRIHEGPRAEALGALAYAQGTEVHFAPGQYQPESQHGQELLGHELAHVVQQSQGRVKATMQSKGVGVNDDAELEREADEMGAKAACGESVGAGGSIGVQSAGFSTEIQLSEKPGLTRLSPPGQFCQLSDQRPKAQSQRGSIETAHDQTPAPVLVFGDTPAVNATGQDAPVQRLLIYSYIHQEIHSANQDEDYYRNIGFQVFLSRDGCNVWADPRNAAAVAATNVAPAVLAREQRVQEADDDQDDDVVDDQDEPVTFDTVQDLMDNAHYVDQDYGQDHYFIGYGVAYTYHLVTCTAIAIHHGPTGLSYLKHADAGTDPEQVRLSVNEYIAQLIHDSKDPIDIDDIEVTIYATTGDGPDNRQSSFETIRAGVSQIQAPQAVVDLFQYANIHEDTTPFDHIVVGGGAAPDIITPEHIHSTYEFALRRIAAGADESEQVYGSSYLHIIRTHFEWHGSGQMERFGDLVAQAAVAAAEHENDATAEILQRMLRGEYPDPPQLLLAEDNDAQELDPAIEAEVDRRVQALNPSWADWEEVEDKVREQVLKEIEEEVDRRLAERNPSWADWEEVEVEIRTAVTAELGQ